MKRLCLIICMFVLILSESGTAEDAVYDDFEDGVIDTNLWITLGNKGGQGAFGTGGWQHSFNEYPNGDGDDYLEARVWGPKSGLTYWGEASVRTTYNFNDGNQWLINFTWETTVGYNPHVDWFAIQITDGGFPQIENAHWLWNVPPGTINLWLTGSGGEPDQPVVPFSKRTWSIAIDPAGTASFYQSPNAEGTAYSQVALDLSKEWYIRFVQVDATSSGFDGGDNTFKLYDFSAVCEPVGPVAYWSFDDTGDPGRDDSGNGHDGTVDGAEPVNGICGNALSFDGVDDHVDMGLPSDLRITGPITVGSWFWADPAALSEHPKIVSRCSRDVYSGYSWETRLYWGRPEGWISQNGYHHILAFGSEDVSSNEWHHLAMTYQPDDFIKLYLDGDLVGQVLGDSVPDYINNPDGVPIYVGAFYWEGVTPGSPFTGNIDEVQIYDRALSPCEIKELATPCEPAGLADIAAIRIREAIAEKIEALEKIGVALGKEWVAYDTMEELLESGDYGDLKKGDVVTAKQRIHSAIHHQEQSKKALEKSIEKLEDSLAVLGRPLLPNTIQHR